MTVINILKPDQALELKPNTRYLIEIVSEISQSNNAQQNDHELLEKLAGTWTEVDEKEFLKNTKEFNQTALQYDLGIFSYDQHFQFIENLVSGTCLEDFTYD